MTLLQTDTIAQRPRASLAPAREPASPAPPDKIRLENVSVTFEGRRGDVQALEDVSLAIRPGEFVCLVGPSGCGKSTLLNIIGGLLPVREGKVFKDDQPIRAAGPDRAVIFQESALFPWLSAVQNVEFALKHIRSRRERRERAMHFLQMVHLTPFDTAK